MVGRKHDTSGRWAVIVLAVLGVASVVGLFTALGLDVDGLAGGARLVAATAFATALVLGVGLRANHPVGSTMLLLAGAAAPAMAWYTRPPAYILSLVIAVVVWVTRPTISSSTV
jgi:hypothetical protein